MSNENPKATVKIMFSMLGKMTKITLIDSTVVNDRNYTQRSEIAELFN